MDSKPEWLALPKRAQDEGHRLQLHAFDHGSTLEFGVAPGFMLDTIPDATVWREMRAFVQASDVAVCA